MKLADENAIRITKETPALSDDEICDLSKGIPEWTVKDKLIARTFEFKDFDAAMEFSNKVADIAKQADHHPEICINYNKVVIQLTTHKIGGLSRNDFIVAARIDRISCYYCSIDVKQVD